MADPSSQSGREPTEPGVVLRLPLEALPDPLPVPRLGRGFDVSLRPPGSKSLTNRAILLASLAEGESTLVDPLLHAEDTERMLTAVAALGAVVRRETEASRIHITGVAGRWRTPTCGTQLDLNNAGTAVRFLAAAAVLSPASITVDGNTRMRERPIGELGDLLEALGAQVAYLGQPGCPPVRITPPRELPAGLRLEIETTASSQFVSGLLLIAPWLPGGMTLVLRGEITSRLYIEMTLGVLEQLGATVRTSEDLRVIRIARTAAGPDDGRGLKPFTHRIEPDASSAITFWAAAALNPGSSCRIEGVGNRSLQPDVRFGSFLERMGASVECDEEAPAITVRSSPSGALLPITADLSLMPDSAMTLAALACFADGRSVLRGLRTLRHKETDRIAALEKELAKIGVQVETEPAGASDSLAIMPPRGGIDCTSRAAPVEFETYDDHRMAMALGLIGLRRPGVFIRNPRCVGKTYPIFWADLARLY